MKQWNEMTREEIEASCENLVIITIGATEQHGSHLPVSTDNFIVETIAKESVRRSNEQIPIILGPHIPFGFSHHHFLYAGAISLSIQTLLTVLKEIVESMVKSGFTKIFILNSHGGNDEIIRLAAKEIGYVHDVNIGAASYWSIAKDKFTVYLANTGLYDVGHAGQFETSLMMAIEPALVHMDRLQQKNSNRKATDLTFEDVVRIRPKSIWKEIDGYSDEPEKAQREIGELLLNQICNHVRHVQINN
ncbi:creatininase family protein [Virgibacillus sp. 179-BFC.A HS]|uniref:Creatininase family protein n=1 Tax=Tigheibacillus jepli TaxID=3035914 RepID=A0ABU5CJ99_9BACI|nr:creatininase family protein [Virgibacillus sp. 179-BFC.A HS]MDY0406310.1 creatininase family protein [Virgibacillus sp. 179-BFC.A HS]